MSTEIQTPFGLSPFGSVTATSDPNVQAQQHIESICSTMPGERVMRPTYGVPLQKYVFSPGADMVANEINRDVTSQLAAWEPAINVLSVTPVANDSFGVANVSVDFSLNPAATSSSNVATVSLGGTVTETVVVT